jgi:hypothetical protein
MSDITLDTTRFNLHGLELAYTDARYNTTRQNERAVEVPAGLHLYNKALAAGKSVLEIGAVLPHYLPNWPKNGHTVVDLFEKGRGITNDNVLTWQPPRAYDLIISISTLDHLLGPMELWLALERMRRWRNPGGLLFITLPANQPPEVGGGPWLDALLKDRHALEASDLWRMDKVTPQWHLWEEVTGSQKPALGYNSPTWFANTVYFLFFGEVIKWWIGEI